MDWIKELSQVATHNEWTHETFDTAISMVLPGVWGGYQVVFRSDESGEVVRAVGGFELKVPLRRIPEIRELIGLINKTFEIGHFAYDLADHLVVFNLVLYQRSGELSRAELKETALLIARLVDVHYPAFMRLVWGQLSPRHALAELTEMAAATQ